MGVLDVSNTYYDGIDCDCEQNMLHRNSNIELRNSVHKNLSKNAKLFSTDFQSVIEADFLSPNAKAIYIFLSL
jgi:hypothetical protein